MSIRGFFEDIFGEEIVEGVGDLFDYFTNDSQGQVIGSVLTSAILNQSGLLDPKIPQVGYQGGIPEYQAMRRQVPVATGIEQINQTIRPMGTPSEGVDTTGRVLPLMYDPNRRPGSGGRRYFTDVEYTPTGRDMGEDKAIDSAGIAAAQTRQDQQTLELLRRNLSNPAREERARLSGSLPAMAGPMPTDSYVPPPEPTDDPVGQLPPDQDGSFAQGGIAALKKGKYLNGDTDGMADEVPATINGKQPAALSDGEFVIPADVVSHLGNGNSDAGAKILEQMMARVRKERTGNKEQGKEINARNMLPA
jgi:hypothetical protein